MQAHIFVAGQVQGVWYRDFVKKNASTLGLTGWVRNLADNRVEAVIQGPKAEIEKIIELCRVGPPLAEVNDVKVEWQDIIETFEDFQII